MQLKPSAQPQSNGSFMRRPVRTTFIVVLAFSATFMWLDVAQAGIVSSVFSWFTGGPVSAEVSDMATNTPNLETVDILQAASNINPNPENRAEIAPVDGGVLIPDIAATNNASGTEPLNTQISIYTVREGDTIASVAKMFNVSVNTVLWTNDLTSKSTLKPGQNITILPISGITYTIKKGDSVENIAKKYGADTTDIIAYNDIDASAKLIAGGSLIIPDAELSSADIASAQPVKSASQSHGRLKVAPYEPILDGWNWPVCNDCFVRPVVGGYISQTLHGHNAIDIAAPVGTPIRAMADGTVIISKTGGWNGGYGTFVAISHSVGGLSTQTLYAHMSRTAVTPGQHVVQGQTIGYIGVTGMTTGPHVHFEVRGAKNIFN